MDSVATTLHVLEQNMHIIDMAFDYLSIDSSEKEKITTLLEKKSAEGLIVKLSEIFKEANLISDEEIQYLHIFDEQLQTLCLDQQFARLAIANGLASKKDVANAFKHQQTYFKKYRINMKIGDVLVEEKIITNSDKVSILLTQNRIKDENLPDALNDICPTQIQKEAINKRFGILAIKNKLVTIEQVNAALKVQKNTQENSRFISQILQETADLSDSDIHQTLLEQKQIEKKRLDLENALYPIQAQIEVSKKLNQLFEYTIAKDGFEAYVKKIKKTDEFIPIYEFLIWLRRAGIKFGVVNDAILEEFIQTAEKNTQIIVAKGSPLEQCINETVQFYFKNEFSPVHHDPDQSEPDNSEPDQAKSIEKNDTGNEKKIKEEQSSESDVVEKSTDDLETEKKEDKKDNEPDKEEGIPDKNEKKSDDELLFFKKGSLLARIIPGKKGKPGKNVFGYLIQPDKPSICVLNAESGVTKKGVLFFAQIDGRPVLKKKGTSIWVEPIVKKTEIETIQGSISNDTENTYESASVEVNGTITSGAILRCQSLLLYGSLMGCVISTGDIDIKGNIGSDKKPKDKESIQQASIICQGSLKASKFIIHSHIQTAGKFLAPNSIVIGSEVIAFKGMTIGDVQKGEHTPSILQFGLKPGDKIPSLDHTIETKTVQLSVLKKDEEVAVLTKEYKKELQEAENHQMEQAIFKNLVEIIEGPELYQHEGLDDKIKYLHGLPAHSSIKAYYLKLPETDAGLAMYNQIMTSARQMSLGMVLKDTKQKIDPEPEDENTPSNTDLIETQFKARLAALENEIAEKSDEIEKIENEIKGLQALRAKLGSEHIKSLSRSSAAIKIKNKCEKGTIIKGKIARLVVEKTIYNITFKEVIDPQTNTVSIIIEAD